MTFATVKIGELVDRGLANIQTGPFGTQLKASEYVSEGIPVINVRNIGYGTLRADKLEFVTESTSERLAVHTLEDRDIVFGRKGAVDRHLLVTPDQAGWVQGSDCIRLRLGTAELRPRFVSYFFLRSYHREWMLLQCGNKATMASLNQDVIRRIELPIPRTDQQDEVVSILAGYDDLIANNRRRISLLEESSRLLYREWFVHLRFPGHEHVEVVDGVPKGWKKQTFDQVCTAIGGGTPSTENPAFWIDGDIPWYTPTDITRNSCLALLDSEKKITDSGLRGSSAKMLPAGTVLMTSRASVGFFGIIDLPSCTNQGFISIIPHEPGARMYLLHNLMHRVEEIRSHAGGATYKEISKGKFRALSVISPHPDLLREFEDQVATLHTQVVALHNMNRKLADARDLLLPRLMSGEIAV